jgi:hypothetical protein
MQKEVRCYTDRTLFRTLAGSSFWGVSAFVSIGGFVASTALGDTRALRPWRLMLGEEALL